MATSFLAKNKAQKNANRTMYSGMRDKRILIYGDNSQGKTKQTADEAHCGNGDEHAVVLRSAICREKASGEDVEKY